MMHVESKNLVSIRLLVGILWIMTCFGVAWADPATDPMIEELDHSGLLRPFGINLAESSSTGSIEELVSQALRQNPALRSNFAEYQSMASSIQQVTGLPDPKLGYTEYLKPVETRVGPQRRAFSLSQSFPWFGSLSLKGKVVGENAEAVRSSFLNASLEVMADVKTAYYNLGYQEQAVRITRQHVSLMTQVEDVSRARYSAGSGKYTDVIKAQVELGVLMDRLAGLEDKRQPLAAVLNGLLDRPSSTVVQLGAMPSPKASTLDLKLLSETMATENPLLAAWDHRARASLNAGELAGKQGLPSFSLGVNYIMTGAARMDGVSDSGEDALMASLGVTIPIWQGKYDAASKVAASRYQGALSSKRGLMNKLSTSLELSHFRYRDALRKFDLYGTSLLPKGRQSLGAARTAYEAGNGSFLNLVDAQRLVLEFELTMVRARFDALIQEAVMEKLTAASIASSASSITGSSSPNNQKKDK